jgi:DNA-binding response OmpR family regulator
MTTKPILLVEDDENDVFFFQRAASKAGLLNTIRVARDGQEAIDYLQGVGKFAERAQFPLPCLIMLDLKLPFVMGLDVLKWIRQQPSLAPIVLILSSSREEADIATAYRLGAQGYLVKPAETDKLVDMVKAINEFWLTQNTPPAPQLNRGLERVADPRAQGHTLRPCASAPRPTTHAPSDIHRRDL